MKYIQIGLILGILLVLHHAVFVDIPYQFAEDVNVPEMQRILLNRKIYLMAIIVLLLLTYVKYISKNSKITSTRKPLLFSLMVSLVICYVVELYFTFKTKSHAIGYSYSGKLWMLKYWNPISQSGFRDEMSPHNPAKKVIFFIGDSFTAGHGIEEIKDRYSDLVKESLPDYNVYNLGINGIGTKKEMNLLMSAPVKPAIIFWQYFFNDIDELLPKYNYEYSFTPYRGDNVFIRKIVKGSFFFNYLYWSIPHKDAQGYLDALEKGMKDKELVKEHLRDCDSVITYCLDNDIKLVLVCFPLFVADDDNIFNRHTRFVADYFASRSVDVIRVGELTESLKMEEKVVNNFDPHAGKEVNRRVAEHILKKVKI